MPQPLPLYLCTTDWLEMSQPSPLYLCTTDWLEVSQAFTIVGSLALLVAWSFTIGWMFCIAQRAVWVKITDIVLLIVGSEYLRLRVFWCVGVFGTRSIWGCGVRVCCREFLT